MAQYRRGLTTWPANKPVFMILYIDFLHMNKIIISSMKKKVYCYGYRNNAICSFL